VDGRERDAHLSSRVDYDLGRVRGFSDCVFAVAITIVVITFVLPSDRTATDATVAHDLVSEWPRYLSYLAAFAVIGYTWMVHHQLFEVIRRVDTAAVWINLALLSFVVLTPYPMQLLGRQPTLAAPYVLFNLDAFLFGIINYLLVLYATDEHRLVWRRLPPRGLQILRWRAAVFPMAIGAATVIAIPFGAWSVLAWGLVPLGRWLVRSRLGALADLEMAIDDVDDEDETVARAARLESESLRAGRPGALAGVFAESGSLTRLVGFSDNVYAFAITLLVLQFSVPTDQPLRTDSELWSLVVQQLQPDLTGFFIGFAVIGLFWVIHHRDFLIIERQDAGLRTVNLIHLMFIAVMPFATLVVSSYDRYTSATILYAVCAGLASASLVVLLVYATRRHRLVDPSIPWAEIRVRRAMGLIPTAGFALSVPVAMVSPTAAQLLWFIPFLGTRVFRERALRRED
jgi:TMEM175 potassium channel family protein